MLCNGVGVCLEIGGDLSWKLPPAQALAEGEMHLKTGQCREIVGEEGA